MWNPLRIAAVIVLATSAGCAPRSRAAAGEYVLVTLKSGPRIADYGDEERQRIQADHLDNIGRLAEERTLVVAGPYGKVNHDPTSRGIFILDVTSLEAARDATNSDPAVHAGVLSMELARFWTTADLRGALEADLAREAEDKAAGIDRPMSERIRPFTIVRAADGDKVERALRDGLPPDKLVVAGRVERREGFFIVDAPDVATLRGWLGKATEGFGQYTIDEWWASSLLVKAASQ